MAEDGALDFMKGYRDAEKVAHYSDGTRRFVPGLETVHRMTGLLLAERVPEDGRILVLGAGGGMELKALAEAYPGWRFVGVDPAPEMLALAERTLGPLMERVELVEGYIDDAPAGPFDGATCLLTLHFLDAEERCRTAAAIRERLHRGAPFVAVHGSFPQGEGERALWLSRYAAFAVSSGVDPALAENARDSVDRAVNMFTPEQDETILRAAGFAELGLFYAAFTWRGWVGTA
nr:class I SAM-dependent methyltransferase [Sphingomonas sp. Y57]